MKNNNLRRLSSLLLTVTLFLSLTISAYANNGTVNESNSSVATITMTAEAKAVAEFKEEVIKLVNVEREKVKLAPLIAMDKLTTASDKRAVESSRKFSHTRPDGTRCFTVLKEFSLSYKAAGENLAYGFKTPEALVKAWMNSSGHKANILDPDFTYIGIGYYKNENGRIYVSQLFYRPSK